MEDTIKKLDEKQLLTSQIKEDYEKYKKGKNVLAKLAKANKILAESPPPIFYTHKPVLYSDIILANQTALAHASEPSVEYGKAKKDAEE